MIRSLEVGFALQGEDAVITFGGKNSNMYSSLMTFQKANTQDLWSLNVTSLKYGKGQYKDIESDVTAVVLLHTPFILLPTSIYPIRQIAEYNYFFSEVNKSSLISCVTDEVSSILVCDAMRELSYDDFGELSFVFYSRGRESEFSVSAEHYINITSGGHRAIFKVIHVSDIDYIGLGTSFLRDLYVHLNAEYNEISLGWK
jgi:hypothetical protein